MPGGVPCKATDSGNEETAKLAENALAFQCAWSEANALRKEAVGSGPCCSRAGEQGQLLNAQAKHADDHHIALANTAARKPAQAYRRLRNTEIMRQLAN